jgi:UDP-N-acetylmuramate dehydrogenase
MPRLREVFGPALQENVVLANFTTAHVGGRALALLPVHTLVELEKAVRLLWEMDAPFHVLGSGSNVLVSDAGFAGVAVINRARNVKVDVHHEPFSVWAESGANLGTVARQVALRGLAGLEWAATIPGTVGGAVYGNAGAQGGDMRGNLLVAEILHPTLGRAEWTVEQMGYDYRSSTLKREIGRKAVILAGRMQLWQSTPETVQARMDEFADRRRQTQPPGASLGSMFKNPPGDYAGRLIEAAGLKGSRAGDAEISSQHANFFINHGHATGKDVETLIGRARKAVFEQFGVRLELEVELLGEWSGLDNL